MLGPTLKWTDTTALFDLSIQCQSALAIRRKDPSTLNALDDQSTLDALVNRLDDQLRFRWMEQRQNTKPTFQYFADWIKDRAKISRLNKDTSTPKPSQTHTETPQFSQSLIKTPSNFNNRSSVQTSKPVQRSSSRDSQRSNPGDREFRDTVRKLHKNTPSNSNYKNQRTNPGDKPYSSPFRPPRSRDQSPSTSEPSCAWCSANGRPHVHATSDCAMLKMPTPSTNGKSSTEINCATGALLKDICGESAP